MTLGGSKKRPRLQFNPSAAGFSDDSSFSDSVLNEASRKNLLLRRNAFSHSSSSPAAAFVFDDSSSADVILRLLADEDCPLEISESSSFSATDSFAEVQVHLHSQVIRRSKYFAALLSDRWQSGKEHSKPLELNLSVPKSPGSIDVHLTALRLLYNDDLSDTIDSASAALDLLPVALELLFEDCVVSCVRFLEAVPWTEEEEKRVMSLIPFLKEEESKELLARVYPGKNNSCEEMLHDLISAAIHNYPNVAIVKAFVAKILREFSSRDTAKRVLEKAFETSLKIVKESLEHYSSPDFRGDHNETEAIQRLNLHTALTNGKHLLWLVERMIELRVADAAVKEWSEQSAFTADLQRAFREDAWRNIAPGLPTVVLRCTCRLANAVAAGTILASRQVRKKLVKDWLSVLIVCKDKVSPMSPSNKLLYLELEETFLRIISTLPMPDAHELLQQCLSLSTRNIEDCPHLVTAFNTWFRRASQTSQGDNLSLGKSLPWEL